jgi:hypothetical protein
METDKMHERILEIQKNIQSSDTPPEKQSEMLGELLGMVSQIEQSLSNIKIDIDNIKINEE